MNLYNFGLLAQLVEPLTVTETPSRDHSQDWKLTMDKKYNSLIANKTWEFVDPLLHCSLISTKWFFRHKYTKKIPLLLK